MVMPHGREAFLTGLCIGAGVMFLLDPQGGGRRRALLRDQLAKSAHKGADAFDATRRDVSNRAAGTAARVRGMFRRRAVDDRILADRVRSQLGHVVSHPRALVVTVDGGRVTLGGPILQEEVPDLLTAIRRVPGVQEVVTELDVHPDAAGVPALQGEGRRRAGAWSPAMLLTGGAAALLTWGLVSRSLAQHGTHVEDRGREVPPSAAM
jgi:BON domain